jgi:putative ABC transport system substrate-binding protein
VLDELKERGFVDGQNIKVDYRNAQGNATIAAQIARQFAGDSPAVIVPISTTSAQSVVTATSKIPVVFGAISDPLSAKLVTGPGPTGTNVTGTSDFPPVEQQVAVIRELLPRAKTIGVVYSPAEVNAVAQIAQLKAAAPKAGFTLVEAPAMKSADVQTAVRSLVGRSDLVYVPGDNAVVAAMDALLAVTRPAKMPVFTPEDSGVKKGALAALGHDYYKLGRQTGAMVARVLQGTAPGTIAWEIGKQTELVINRNAAREMGIDIPPGVAKRARLVGSL